jgi:tRNA nucleotidyltransferase/poly(A) polymerase
LSSSLPIANSQLLLALRTLARQRRTPVILVGGTVRDALLGKTANDVDLAVQGNPVPLARAAADALDGDFWLMDAERGTARVILRDGARTVIDFAACRGATWREDLLARDFTLNAMGYDLEAEALIDPTGGQNDLEARTIRAVSDHSISDDPIRALRAVRLAQQLGFAIEPMTWAQAAAIGSAIHTPSAERARDELLAMLALPTATQAMRQLDALGLLAQLVPEVEPMRTCTQSPPHQFDVLEHTWAVMEAMDGLVQQWAIGNWLLADQLSIANSPLLIANLQSHLSAATANATRATILKFAALLHDCAKPQTRSVDADGRIRFFTHEERGAEVAAARARALKLSGDEVSAVRTMVRHHMRANQLARAKDRPTSLVPTSRAIYRFMREAGNCAPELALFAMADCWGKRGPDTQPDDCADSAAMTALLLEKYFAQFSPQAAPAPLITGRDVMEMGVAPGRLIGQILEHVREAHMTGEIGTRDEALALARGEAAAAAGSNQNA